MGNATNRSGVSLVEVITAVAVLGIAIPPIVSMFTEVARHSPDDLFQNAAIHAADSLMEEIVSKAYEDPDLPPGSFGTEELLRRVYDDVDDFDGYTNAAATPTPTTAVAADAAASSSVVDSAAAILTNDTFAPYGGIVLSAWVDNVLAADTDPTVTEADGNSNYKRITVRASWSVGDGGAFQIKTLRAKLPTILADTGPLDELGSAGSATVSGTNSIDIVLINPGTTALEIASVKMEADRSTPPLLSMWFGRDFGPLYLGWLGFSPTPTNELPLYFLPPDYRTIPPESFMETHLRFLWSVSSGPITYTLTYTFTDGSQSVLIMPLEMP